MKKLWVLLGFIAIVIGIYLTLIMVAKDYRVEYEVDNYTIVEEYHKDDKYYSFMISNDELVFDYIYETKYSNNRKLVEEIKVEEEDDYLCIKPIVKDMKFEYICYDGMYKSPYLVGLKEANETKKINTYNSINIYSKDYDYYIWNGHGLTNILSKEEYNFIDDELYDNNLAIKVEEYILFANYNQKRVFDSFYIFDYKKEEIRKWDFDYEIDFDSYFMGHIEKFVYLFDRKNSVQYKINVSEETIEVSSDKEGSVFFDGKWGTKANKELKYTDHFMEDDNLYDFILDSKRLYLNVNNSKNNILISNLDIHDILDKNKDHVYYLVDDSIYIYKINKGEYKLLDYFEWNFSYKNKVYIFD